MISKSKFPLLCGAALWCAAIAPTFVFPGCAQAQNAPQTDAPWKAVIAPDNSLSFTFYKDAAPSLYLSMGGWGPNWGWRGFGAGERAQNGELNATSVFEGNKDAGEIIHIALKARQTAPNAIAYEYTLSADKDVPLTMLVLNLSENKGRGGDVVVTQTGDAQQTLPVWLPIREAIDNVKKIIFRPTDGGESNVAIEPPAALGFDNGIRVMLAKDKFAAGTKTVTLTFTFPQPVSLMASDADMAKLTQPLAGPDWFAFQGTNDIGPSALGFQDWLREPAGKRGGVRMVGDHFQLEDGTPIKFWGTNLSYDNSAPDKAAADFTAARFAKWGINAVRMHKFTDSGWEGIGDPNDATQMVPEELDKLDYFADQLAKNGVYYGWSHTYKFRPQAANRDKLLAYDEVKNIGDAYGLINVAPDIQDLLIERTVNLLNHPNPYTGKTYAQDPALAYVEMHNEDDIFFYSLEGQLNRAPTYKKAFLARYSAWLQKKYGSTSALKVAWGDSLGDQTLEAKNVDIQANPWFFSEDNLPGKSGGERQRLLDNAAFFHDTQNEFYQKFSRAIRATGYKGPLIGSPWQAPSGLPQLYNMASDAGAGYIDRHNYFGGGLNDTMLKAPGSGLLSTGLQQVAGRPFGFSEWISVYPSLYSAEGPPLMAAYGLGLQGWDASYEFQSNSGTWAFSDIVGKFPWGIWTADSPTQIGQFPILARMIARGDIPQGADIAVRRVSPQDLADGKFDFSDKVVQAGDVKTFGGSVPAEALAAGRCVVDFTDATGPSTLPDMSKYWQGDALKANNGALMWDAKAGYFTINTAGTKGIVGFAGGKDLKLGSFRANIATPYASLLVTAAEKTADLTNCKSALISAVARSANSGANYFTLDQRMLENGKGPILMEPVKATLAFGNRKVALVNVLDADGKRTGKTLTVANGAFTIDEARDKTIYYEVVFG